MGRKDARCRLIGKLYGIVRQIYEPLCWATWGGVVTKPPNPFRWFDPSPKMIRLAEIL